MKEALYVMGNGKLCAYGYRGNLEQIFGMPYSAPSIGTIILDLPDGFSIISKRISSSAIWIHEIIHQNKTAARITEFADTKSCCFVRKIETTVPLTFRLLPNRDAVKIRNNTRYFPQASFALSLIFQREAHIYCEHTTGREIPDQILCTGNINWEENDNQFILRATGECFLYITSGENYAACIEETEFVLNTPFSSMYERTLRDWELFRERRGKAERDIQSPQLLQALDDICVLIKAQQSYDGGILAGHQYHLAYVRDMLGVSLFLLEIGYLDEVRNILEFYNRIYEKYGYIKNAQAMGIPGIFHIHENDNVEITGYLLVQSFRYLQASGDTAFIAQIAPMLRWAFESQEKELIREMLPFNGDETYVAGYMLPRYTLLDGSAEATMLFILGGELALEEEILYCGKQREEKAELIRRVKKAFRTHFFIENRFIVNQPGRLPLENYPRFKYGICENCTAHTWLEQNQNHRYLCPDCFADVSLPPRNTSYFELPSVTLSPIFVGSDLFKRDELQKIISDMIHTYNQTGLLPSQAVGNGQVGYDFGLLLNALAALHIPEGEKLYRDTLELRDEVGAWAEYYRDGQPLNTRCRPWESAINLYGCIQYYKMVQQLHLQEDFS